MTRKKVKESDNTGKESQVARRINWHQEASNVTPQEKKQSNTKKEESDTKKEAKVTPRKRDIEKESGKWKATPRKKATWQSDTKNESKVRPRKKQRDTKK